MDRSRLFALVLSPESVASYWVDFEIQHILATRSTRIIIPILLREGPHKEVDRGERDIRLVEPIGRGDVGLGVLVAIHKVDPGPA